MADHLDMVLYLLAGSLIGTWWAVTLSRKLLNRIVLVLLALAMLSGA